MEKGFLLEKSARFIDRYWFVILSIVLIPSFWALFVSGFYGASDDLHVAWLYEMDQLFKIGQFPPRFVPDLSFGFGYPLFNFVFPLPFYIGEFFHLLGLNFVDSIKAVFLSSILLSAFFMYILMRQFSSRIVSLAAAMLYVYTPYRATDLYVRGAIGECVAFIFFPLVALGVVKLTNELPQKANYWISLTAFSVAGLILSHNIATYMFLPLIVILGVIRIKSLLKNQLSAYLRLFIAFLGGFLVTSYFWLPALLETKLMKYDTVFNFVDHFPTFRQLITPLWGYGASVPGPYDGMSFFIGGVNLFLVAGAITGLWIFKKKLDKDTKIFISWGLFSFACAVVLMNYRSTILWMNLPLIQYFQFPWRFLMLTTFVTPLFLCLLERVRFKLILSWGIIVIILMTNFFQFRPHDFLNRQDSYYLKRYIPTPKADKEYYEHQEEYLRLPKDVLTRPEKNHPLIIAKQVEFKVDKFDGLNAQIETQSQINSTLYYNKYYFPGWKAVLDGKIVPIEVAKPFGQISISIPSGLHRVNIFFSETPFRMFLNLLSCLSIAIFLIILNQKIFKRLCQLFRLLIR